MFLVMLAFYLIWITLVQRLQRSYPFFLCLLAVWALCVREYLKQFHLEEFCWCPNANAAFWLAIVHCQPIVCSHWGRLQNGDVFLFLGHFGGRYRNVWYCYQKLLDNRWPRQLKRSKKNVHRHNYAILKARITVGGTNTAGVHSVYYIT